MIFGVNATKSAVIIAVTKGAGDKFVITAIRSTPFQVRSGDDLTESMQGLLTIFDRKGKGALSLLISLRQASPASSFTREMGDFVAHPTKDRGIIFEHLASFIMKVVPIPGESPRSEKSRATPGARF